MAVHNRGEVHLVRYGDHVTIVASESLAFQVAGLVAIVESGRSVDLTDGNWQALHDLTGALEDAFRAPGPRIKKSLAEVEAEIAESTPRVASNLDKENRTYIKRNLQG